MRLNYIDNFKALAILGMIFCHSIIFGTEKNVDNIYHFIGHEVLGDWPAAFFITISGYMLNFKEPSNLKLLKRGIFLVLLSIPIALLIVISLACVYKGILLSFYPLSISLNIGLLGIILILFSFKNSLNFSNSYFCLLSKYSLTCYCLQYLIIEIFSFFYTIKTVSYGYFLGLAITVGIIIYLKEIERLKINLNIEYLLKRVAG